MSRLWEVKATCAPDLLFTSSTSLLHVEPMVLASNTAKCAPHRWHSFSASVHVFGEFVAMRISMPPEHERHMPSLGEDGAACADKAPRATAKLMMLTQIGIEAACRAVYDNEDTLLSAHTHRRTIRLPVSHSTQCCTRVKPPATKIIRREEIVFV
eukprot:scpid52250/ scgid14394/ 